ncbi:glycosyltransferase family 10 [Helicobacter sp. 16-1353]|uniref:glycosyltransferase family 10 domain-containing protein n=1 Tax=Helicobacter sp. 16-1353 TaxID=2004996 RepID=UPI0015EE3D13|nr:glycosyltransferase family 10 [Helicobacter sp. 16-1353]
MKTIKLKVVDWSGSENFDDIFTVKILRKYFNVVESENPDFIFYATSGYEHIKYDCVRIQFLGENIIPDFNVCDYAFGLNHIIFEDRYIYVPHFIDYRKDTHRAREKHKISDISHKKKFCNYIYSNSNAAAIRGDFFDFLNKYKRVDAAGKDRNNMGEALPKAPNGDFGESKYEFMKEYKFSIAFENSSTNGYCTEKILQAFAAGTIPIYWGDKKIAMGGGINPKSFINVSGYDDFEAVLEKIKELDNDDEKYLKMLQEPVFLPLDSMADLAERGKSVESMKSRADLKCIESALKTADSSLDSINSTNSANSANSSLDSTESISNCNVDSKFLANKILSQISRKYGGFTNMIDFSPNVPKITDSTPKSVLDSPTDSTQNINPHSTPFDKKPRDFVELKEMEIEAFLIHIFSQEPSVAFRRKNEMWHKIYDSDYRKSKVFLRYFDRLQKTMIFKILRKLGVFRALKKLLAQN